MRLRGKVAIITGGGRGIGAAIAERFAREGASLVICSRTAGELHRSARSVEELGGAVSTVSADVAECRTADSLVGAALGRFGKVDVLVNAAAVLGPIGRLWTVEAREWIDALNVNLLGTFLCCRAVVPRMIEAGRGRIINFSGGGASGPRARFSSYASSKAAVVRLTETLAQEVAEFGIQVNAIAPGLVDTGMQDAVLAAGETAGAEAGMVRRARESGRGWVSPDLVAELAVYLASNAPDKLTGKLISAPYDQWQAWDEAAVERLAGTSMLTLRRIDDHTLRPLLTPDDSNREG